MTAKVHLWEVNCPECLSRLNAVPASKPDADEVIRELEEALKRIVSDFEMDFVLDGVVVDEPYRTHKQAWEVADAALSRAAAYRKEKERG